MAHWLLSLLAIVGVQRAALIAGHSMGSLIALQAAARSPERVSVLALVATAYPMHVSEELLGAAAGAEQRAIDMVNIWSHSSMAHKPSCPGPGFSVLGGNRRLMQKIARQPRDLATTKGVFLTDFVACNSYANGESAARLVACPTLLLLGANDQMTPPKATALLRSAIVRHQVVQIPQCGHNLMAEQPDATLDALFEFATRNAPAPAA